MRFYRRDLVLLAASVLFTLAGAMYLGVAAIGIGAALFFGMKMIAVKRQQGIEREVGEGLCVECGQRVVDGACPECGGSGSAGPAATDGAPDGGRGRDAGPDAPDGGGSRGRDAGPDGPDGGRGRDAGPDAPDGGGSRGRDAGPDAHSNATDGGGSRGRGRDAPAAGDAARVRTS